MIDFRSARDTRASAFDYIQVRIASPEEIRGPKDGKERERLEMAGEVRPAARDADAVVALGQRPNQMAAKEAGTTENRDERVVAALKGHDSRLRPAPVVRNYRKGAGLYRGSGWPHTAHSIAFIDKGKRPPLSVPRVPGRTCPGGGIGRRTSFRY